MNGEENRMRYIITMIAAILLLVGCSGDDMLKVDHLREGDYRY
jgi:major membrane immunogen (membrane-anchored lipoprotein)